MRRIVVVGSQGSGKTHLSLALGAKLGLPIIHLDTLYWRPGWKPSQRDDFRARVAQAISTDGWIVDGSYSGLCLDLTVARADLFVSLERPRWFCVWRVLKRSAFQRRGLRTDLPARLLANKLVPHSVEEERGTHSDNRPCLALP